MPPIYTAPPSSLSGLFSAPETVTSTEVPRLAIALDGLDKCAKTHWALHTAPDPICLMFNDPGTVHVLGKALRSGRRIPHVMELDYKIPDPAVTKTSDVDAATWAEWRREWERCKSGIYALINEDPRSPNRTRTLVRDTETGFWDLCMLSHFGKNVKITQNLRTEANADYAKVFNDLYRGRPDLNMILIHKLKKQYLPSSKGENEWNGQYETAGFNQVAFLVDLTLRAGWDPIRKSMYTELQRPTRYGFHLLDRRWYGDQSGFGWLGLELFPETALDPEKWWGMRF